MKGILLVTSTVLLLLFSHPSLFAQSWNITGNTNATTSSRLGTNNNIPLRFFTNNVERLRIIEAGRVGIGIVSPLNILTVKSSGVYPWHDGSIPAVLSLQALEKTQLAMLIFL